MSLFKNNVQKDYDRPKGLKYVPVIFPVTSYMFENFIADARLKDPLPELKKESNIPDATMFIEL